MSKPTAARIAKLTALRAEADCHGDTATMALVDRAITGDSEALDRLADALRAVKAVSTGRAARAPARARRSFSTTASSHPWAHDEE
jgi:hypothetical protein